MAANQLTNPLKQANLGFTLIELLIVGGLSTMLLLTISAMFMTFLASSASTNISRTLNREGDFAINQLEFFLRNSLDLSCDDGNNQLIVTSLDQKDSTISLEETQSGVTRVASTSAETNYLTSDSVTVTQTDFFECTVSGDKIYVDITLNLQKLDNDGDLVGQPETYNTSVQVRN